MKLFFPICFLGFVCYVYVLPHYQDAQDYVAKHVAMSVQR